MATRRYSVGPGQSLETVVEAVGAATVTAPMEFTVDCASTIVTDNGTTRKITKEEALFALEQFRMYIVRSNWSPA